MFKSKARFFIGGYRLFHRNHPHFPEFINYIKDIESSPLRHENKLFNVLRSDIYALQTGLQEIEALKSMAQEEKDFEKEVLEDLSKLEPQVDELVTRLANNILISNQRYDQDNAVLEVLPGAGGLEASVFAAEVFNLYCSYCRDYLGYNVEVQEHVETTGASDHFAISKASILIKEFHWQDVNPSDLSVTYCRSSGPGGQGVNTTNSAVRMIHNPTKISAHCQELRTAHENYGLALEKLKRELYRVMFEKENSKVSSTRKSQIGQMNRNEKIRTYHYGRNTVLDHRIQGVVKQVPNLFDFMKGEYGFTILDQFYSFLKDMDEEEQMSLKIKARSKRAEINGKTVLGLSREEYLEGLKNGDLSMRNIFKAFQFAALIKDKNTNGVVQFVPNANEIASYIQCNRIGSKKLMGHVLFVSENFPIKYCDSTNGLVSLLDVQPCKHDCAAIKILKNHGALPLCTTNVAQQFGLSTNNPIYGQTTLWGREVGGETGGAASMIASICNDFAVGLSMDIWGSLRMASAFCGCFTLKPTYVVEFPPPDMKEVTEVYLGHLHVQKMISLLNVDLASVDSLYYFYYFSLVPHYFRLQLINQYLEYKNRATDLTKEYLDIWDDKCIDVLITPAALTPAPPPELAKKFSPLALPYISWNLMNMPAGIMPISRVTKKDIAKSNEVKLKTYNYIQEAHPIEGLPLSIQIVGRPYEEEKILYTMEFLNNFTRYNPCHDLKSDTPEVVKCENNE
ncbi:prfA [Lepeophtheirus salmonis]|uniref:PrfA n=1 Tax=Lepeophtheirus salmonis TaxID=72036 RepID=A0A7R8H7Z7_LEPSM|nr:prfA [Lepeophtheirus salmonis]CAF2931441.1 prfA [Lepeophtheirus salmonis]